MFKFNKIKFCIFFMIVPFIFTGCGTMLWGTRQEVSLNSNVPNTKYVIHDFGNHLIAEGRTPAEEKLKRKGAYIVYFDADGYYPCKKYITTRPSGGLFFAGFIVNAPTLLLGWFVDYAKGSYMTLEPNKFDVKLSQNNGGKN